MATIIALVLKNTGSEPDRQMQNMGSHVAKEAGGKPDDIMFVYASGHDSQTFDDLITGFGPTATFAPEQITTLTGLHLPDPARFACLIGKLRENETRTNPRKVMAVIANAEFIKAFLRYYFTVVAQQPEATTMDDFVSAGITIVLETDTHNARLLQVQG